MADPTPTLKDYSDVTTHFDEHIKEMGFGALLQYLSSDQRGRIYEDLVEIIDAISTFISEKSLTAMHPEEIKSKFLELHKGKVNYAFIKGCFKVSENIQERRQLFFELIEKTLPLFMDVHGYLFHFHESYPMTSEIANLSWRAGNPTHFAENSCAWLVEMVISRLKGEINKL